MVTKQTKFAAQLSMCREENARLRAERDSLACEVAALRSGRAIEAALAAVALRTRERDEAREKLARCVEALEEIGKEADHGIPFYAYGDNEAGCDLSTRLSWICGRVGQALAAAKGE